LLAGKKLGDVLGVASNCIASLSGEGGRKDSMVGERSGKGGKGREG
jgi:hypothetical protein